MTEKETQEVVETTEDGKKTFTEEIEVAGGQLVDRVKDLVEEGNVRQLRIKSADDDVYMEMPLTIGVLAGGIDRPYPCPGRRRYRFPRMRGDRPYALSRPDYLIQFPPHARGSTLSRQLRES